MKILDQTLHWARPDLFWLMMPIVLGATMLLLYRLYKVTQVVNLLSHNQSETKQLQHYSFSRQLLKVLFFVLGLIGVTVALMRPQCQGTELSVAQQGRDVIIALDISRSMLATDLAPNRLDFAKQKIRSLVKALKTERVGLLLFSGAAFMQCPLTEDEGAFLMFLDQVDVETISSGTTATQEAIKEAIKVFKKMPERQHKLLIIFTDGEDFSSNLTAVKAEAARIGLHIVTVGVGTPEGAPIPLFDRQGAQQGHHLDADGNVVISRMNSGILHRLALDTGGIFVPIDQKTEDIKKILSFIQQFEKEQLDDKTIKQFQEQYHYPLLFSLICFAIEWLL